MNNEIKCVVALAAHGAWAKALETAMKKRGWLRRNFLNSWTHLKNLLLILPLLFWTSIFLAVAGVKSLERMLDLMPNILQTVIALACPLVATILGIRATQQARHFGGALLSWATVFAGCALFIFALLMLLRPV